MVNTNKLVRNYSGCTGLKTGSTSLALYNLSASASRNGMDLIAVVMKAPSSKIRFKCASTLLDYGFTNFEYKKLLSANESIKLVNVSKGILSNVNAVAKTDCSVILEKGQNMNIEQSIYLPEYIDAPVKKDQTIGTVKFTLNNEELACSDLIPDQSVEKINFITMSSFILDNWVSLLRK